MTGHAPLPRRTPAKNLDPDATAARRRRVIAHGRVGPRVAWATDQGTLRRLADGLRATGPAARS